MKITIKTWLIVIVIMVIVFSGLNIYSNLSGTIKDYKSVIEKKNDKIAYHKDKNGSLIASKEVLELTNAELKDIADDVIFDNARLKSQNIKLKNVNSYLKGELAIKKTDTVTVYDTLIIIGNDTVKGQKFDYKNDYLDFSGTIYRSTLDFTYFYRTDFQYVTHWKNNGFLKGKSLVMDFSLTDPSAILTSAQTINIKPEPKKFYQKNWFWGLSGIAAGIIITK